MNFRKLALFSLLLIGFVNHSFCQSLSVIWPKHNEVISDRTPLFSWNGIEGVQSYQISLSQDSTFAIGGQTFTSPNTQFQLTNNLISGTWFWKVSSNFNNQMYISNLGKFQVFQPTDIPSLCLWLRADTNVVLDASAKIQQWKDLSSQSNHFNQSSISKRPVLNPNTLNSLPAVQFSGAQVLSGGDILDIGTGSRSMFVLGNYTNTTANFWRLPPARPRRRLNPPRR